MAIVRVLLISTYDLGRQPSGLASPAAWLRREGIDVDCLDTSRSSLSDRQLLEADLIAFHLPMHTATRLAGPLVARARQVNPRARVAAYGLYAPLNAAWLREQGVHDVLGAEGEAQLVLLANSQRPTSNSQSPVLRVESSEPRANSPEARVQSPEPRAQRLPLVPDRSTLPPLGRYAALQMPDGTRRVVGTTEATRGCKHLCRHCPIVPVYKGRFRALPLDVVIEDVRAQAAAGAQHISFGDPDFFNGPTHARRLVERLAREVPHLTYDVTIKIEHILRHSDLLDLLRATGCLMITTAVESLDDEVLRTLRKGHTRADFVAAVDLCTQAGIALAPTFIPFTPWTTLDGYVDLLDQIDRLNLVDGVAPIQLAIRLLITAESKLLELPDIQTVIDPFDAQSLTFPWRHPDPRVDRLQEAVMRIVGDGARHPRVDVFHRIYAHATGRPPSSLRPPGKASPYMTEAWYCCAEPGPELARSSALDTV